VAIEKRDGNLYYYRSVRRGDKVHKVYVGAGELGRIAHERDLISRAIEEGREQEERREREKLEALTAPVAELEEVAEVLARAHLIAAGCHRHKGEWRRERRSA
jgi:crotonobetainyl-CoA:carnitine CoA-transferase CaiB-like acyl-CoA transferase